MGEVWQCRFCPASFASPKALGGHQRSHPGVERGPRIRDRSKEGRPKPRLPKKHVALVEDRAAPTLRLFCSTCGHSFPTLRRTDLHRHAREEHGRRPDAAELSPILAVWDEARVEWRADG